METMKQWGLWSSLGTHGSLVVKWWLCIPSSGQARKKFDLEGQGHLPPKTIGILTKLICTSGPNLVILAWMGYAIWYGQAQILTFKLNLTLKVKIDCPPKKK